MPPSRKASGRGVKRKVQQPERYSKDYPVAKGHHYNLRSVPDSIWKGVRQKAAEDRLSVRYVVIRALELYALGRLDLQENS